MFRNVVYLVLSAVSFLYCLPHADGDLVFKAALDASQVVGGSSTETGTAIATFVLDEAQQNLSYFIEVDGLVLDPIPEDRTGSSDIDKIHIHNAPAGFSGPHVLNIFGLPSEDDSQMVVDYGNQTIVGIYDDSDAIDPDTGELFDQNNPLTTKLFSNFVDDLLDEQLYLAIHTAGQNGNIAVRGQIRAIPEPHGACCVCLSLILASIYRRRS